MLKIGITGQAGFVGKHLYNVLGLYPSEFERVGFDRSYFADGGKMDEFVRQCNVIVHLAGVNRHSDPRCIYDTNVALAENLVASLDRCGSKAHVIYSSSTQEERDNPYGRSKLAGRKMLADWAARAGGKFTGMIIPNVFGPFGHPYYNSVIATFCHQLSHNETPVIEADGELKLIYVGELAGKMLECIQNGQAADQLLVPHTHQARVSEILALLKTYRDEYQERGIIPALRNDFELNLFNTYRCYMDIGRHYPVSFRLHTDMRGSFVEVVRLNTGGQVSFSTTLPGITRGNHFHTRKIERFAVIRGKALIQLRQVGTGNVMNFNVSGDQPSYIDMPVWHTHNITNTGEEELFTIFWINECFDPEDPDTYMEVV
ncbi:NAD-dependent epimerase/dehydratase family protein [Chitinophaga sp. GCM10012297]|uniref:NAD-dependent epimerase/dehydratase family protein n=1 Tax=Chitinophaga chungangae TaxID=2821488 RepID=A0ABS3YF12_9BACT|nr:NAD-dependent epimerase/dehydratase family protein [Chitinophaga chungangae]MBO9153270.1 NAD-dependent epimerase/dehydratase family protein [Chitinophaga chungangae]